MTDGTTGKCEDAPSSAVNVLIKYRPSTINDYKIPQHHNPYSHNTVYAQHPNILPIPIPRSRNRSRERWPPPPSVEDEAISLSREHSPALPDLDGGEAQSRGSVDQLPIIVDAHVLYTNCNAGRDTRQGRNDSQSLNSKSSFESLGPQTPPAPLNYTSERRYTWKPKPNIEIPQRYDDPNPKLAVENPEKNKGITDGHSRKEQSSSRPRDGPFVTETILPLPRLDRDSSPYSYSPSSGKSTFSGDYVLSPASMSPDSRHTNTSQDFRKRHPSEVYGGIASNARPRTLSSTLPKVGRPTVDRYVTAMGYPGEHLPVQSPLRPSRTTELSSDESDSSHDELSRYRRKRRSSRYSSQRPEHSPSLALPRYDNDLRQSRQPYANSPNPRMPSNQQPASRDRTPTALPQPYAPGVTSSAPVAGRSGPNRISLPPRASPTTSTYTTPPASPGPDGRKYNHDSPTTGWKSRPGSKGNSRPPSPLSSNRAPYRSGGLELPDEVQFGSHHSSHIPRSRHTSPLPSPEPECPGSSFGIRIGVQEASPARKYNPSAQTSDVPHRPRSRETSAPFILSVPPQHQHMGVPQARRTLSSADPRDRPLMNTEAHRRASDMSVSPSYPFTTKMSIQPPKLLISLPACPRSDFVAGYHDWSTIPGAPYFDVCPTCRTAIEQAGYTGRFQPSLSRPPGYETRCDLSITWIRMAWLLILQNKTNRSNLVHEMMEIVAQEPKCPGKSGATRNWYRLHDPEKNRLVPIFDVCSYCTRSVETLFPNLHGTFHQIRPSEILNQPRTCALRSDSARFPKYVDMLDEISNQAYEYRRPPNMLRFVQLAKKVASIQECNRDDMLLDHVWHYMPHLPEFTVCEECYEDVVWPTAAAGSELADQFLGKLQLLPPGFARGGVSCQLYSPRMRSVFRDACARGDFAMLKKEAVKRWQVERDLQARLKGVRDRVEVAGLVDEWKRWE